VTDGRVEDLLRAYAPQVLGVLVRRYGDFSDAEDAVQEALLAASMQWPDDGVPDNPKAWLVTVATRRLTDHIRSEVARRRREDEVAALEPADAKPEVSDRDDTLTLFLLCCHPALSAPSQLALTLRAVGGLTTAEIAAAFLVPEATMAQRISRAKKSIKGAGFPQPQELDDRMRVVLHVLYLIFNEGYTATSGPQLQRVELTSEAIRLTRLMYALRPQDGEVAGLLALMLLTDARRPARTTPDGELIPLADQDRTRWNADAIAEGVAIVEQTLATARLGPYQVQAAIAAIHAEAPRAQDTDWKQILMLYQVLQQLAPNPVVLLNQAVAEAMVAGPQAGLAKLDALAADERLAGNHRVDAVRAHLLEMAGDRDGARSAYLAAARRTTSLPEQRYLQQRAARAAEGHAADA
jgi:RNA polymerase sigma factor (sigma-70 family)